MKGAVKKLESTAMRLQNKNIVKDVNLFNPREETLVN